MLVRKCDICGGEIRSADTRYKLVFESIFFKKEKDVCKECLQRIASEVRKDNSPQTDLLLKTPRKSRESHEKDTPQTEETCERCVYVRGSQWCQGCNGTPKRWDGEKIVDTPQNERSE